MKFLKRLIYFIFLLSLLFALLVLACAWKPGLTEQIADMLYGDAEKATSVSENTMPEQTAEAETDTPPEQTAEAESDTQPESYIPSESYIPQESYIPPEKENISVPEAVSGKGGYQEITGKESELQEEEAARLEQQLGVGETGDGLVFDALYYPYYEMLDQNGQRIYRQIYANAKALNPAFAPVEPIHAGKLRDVFSAVYNDHPALFWLDTVYACKHRGDGQCVEIDLQFHRTAQNLEKENTVFETAAQEIIAGAEGLGSDYEKEQYVHDTLLRNIEYVRSAEMNQSAYSALVNGRTVCAGYARAFQYLMQQMQIPCYYCTGYAGEDHAWNIICLEDEYYNVDVTWDDTGDGTRDYFNKTDQDYADTHIRTELAVNLPPCNGEKYRSVEVEEAEAVDNGLRSSEELGFSEEDILRDLQEYYRACTDEILQKGKGNYSFDKVIEGEALYQEWEQAYKSDSYQEDYLENAMEIIDAKNCHIGLTVEQLQQDRYLITHELQLR